MVLKFAEYLPKLHTLVLTNNRLVNLAEIDPLSSFPKLQFLSLLDNNITKKPNYRLYVIHRLKSLRLLDFKKVKNKVRLLDCVKFMLIILSGCSSSWFNNHSVMQECFFLIDKEKNKLKHAKTGGAPYVHRQYTRMLHVVPSDVAYSRCILNHSSLEFRGKLLDSCKTHTLSSCTFFLWNFLCSFIS